MYSKRLSKVEEEKESAEQALLEFMQGSCVPLLNTTNHDDSLFAKNFCSSMSNFKKNKPLELDVSWAYLTFV